MGVEPGIRRLADCGAVRARLPGIGSDPSLAYLRPVYVEPGIGSVGLRSGEVRAALGRFRALGLFLATRLHKALTKAGNKNELITIHGGKYGYSTDQDTLAAYANIWKFLGDNVPGLLPNKN